MQSSNDGQPATMNMSNLHENVGNAGGEGRQGDFESRNTTTSLSRSMYDLKYPPKDLASMRLQLFEVKDPIELQVNEFERYWPYVDNVWVRQHKAGTDKTGRYVTDYYACRLQRPTYTPRHQDPGRSEGQPTRKKQIREGGTCQMRLKTIRYEGGYRSCTIMRVGDEETHTHDLDHIDKIKRTSVLMDIARSEVMRGFMPASVFIVMTQDQRKLFDAGGKYLNRNDVRNASQQWRQEHKEELRVHAGYKYDHGNGIVRQTDGEITTGLDDEVRLVDPAIQELNASAPNTLFFPDVERELLQQYIPPTDAQLSASGLPHVTLTYATSMDSSLALAPGLQTHLSGIESKAMTHYLRSKHDAILVGVGTAVADDPALNCRLHGAGGFGGLGWDAQPRPVIIDPAARWVLTPQSKILQTVARGQGKGPWIIIAPGFVMDAGRTELLKHYGGKYLGLTQFDNRYRLRWEVILKSLAAEGIKSVMIEGGGMIINDLLQAENASLIDSVIVTVAPTYLGRGGVNVSPASRHDLNTRPVPAVRFRDVRWLPMGEDVVMCGKMPVESRSSLQNLPAPTPS